MKTEFLVLNEERNVTLTAYLQPVGGEFTGVTVRPAVLILPGGGYHFCSEREADPVALAYLKAGYQAFILRYSLNEQARWPNPLSDYEQAMALIRDRADEWHVMQERIAVIGFSAGGHLAACAATMSKNRPNAAILGYPVIDADSVRGYVGEAPDAAAAVDARTCPCFVFATRTDNLVPVDNSLHFIDALCRNDIAFESHIYSNGPHGMTTGEGFLGGGSCCSRYPRWVEDSVSWLEDVLGAFGEPRFGSRINGNRDETLNLDCTLEYLQRFPEARQLLEELMPPQEGGMQLQKSAARVLTLGSTLSWNGADAEKLAYAARRLGTIKNTAQAVEEE